MFDANMRYLPKGHKFFVEGHISKDNPLRKICTKETKLLKCEMLSKGSENPVVIFKNVIEGREVTLTLSENCTGDDWLRYAGTINGGGFICNKTKAVAEKMGFEEFTSVKEEFSLVL